MNGAAARHGRRLKGSDASLTTSWRDFMRTQEKAGLIGPPRTVDRSRSRAENQEPLATRKDPDILELDTSAARYILIVIVAALGGMINSIAGGGTLLTFPALIGLGVPAIVANATSTVALWPGMLSSMWGYRSELRGVRRWAMYFAIPSVLGGLAGALLLLITPAERFDAAVPWLVLGASILFLIQQRMVSASRRHGAHAAPTTDPAMLTPSLGLLAFQFLVAIYGGYFGAGMGILMLAALGFIGFTSIHRMNGLKNFGALCINAAAAVTFAVSGLVNWRVAAAMAVGSIAGGYAGARLAQAVPQIWVRRAIIVIGFGSGLALLLARL
jgi:uncharacterized protein